VSERDSRLCARRPRATAVVAASVLSAVLPLGAALSACAPAEPGLPYGARAEDCATCHTAHYDEWRASRHAGSATSPVLAALLPRVEAAWGTSARDRCVACHSPGHGGDDGIGCVACHAAVGNRGEQNGALVVDTSLPLAGPFADPEPTDAHVTSTRSLLGSPSLCGTCHEVHGPGLFEEPTLTEYRTSAEGHFGTTCADCHMPALDDAPIADGALRARPRHDHRFVGVDPAWGAPPDVAAHARQAATALLARAMTLTARLDGGDVEILLQNTGAAHTVPTGAAFLRDIWVDVRVVDASGRVFEVARVIELGARLLREDGREVALPTDAQRVEARALAPGGHRSARVALPADAVPPLSVEASLRARPVRADALAALGLPEAPVLEIAEEHAE